MFIVRLVDVCSFVFYSLFCCDLRLLGKIINYFYFLGDVRSYVREYKYRLIFYFI